VTHFEIDPEKSVAQAHQSEIENRVRPASHSQQAGEPLRNPWSQNTNTHGKPKAGPKDQLAQTDRAPAKAQEGPRHRVDGKNYNKNLNEQHLLSP
jgi:hypothetical protein